MVAQRRRLLLSVLLLITWTACNADQPPDEGEIPKPDQPGDKAKNPLARGWGDTINWVELEAGIEIAKKEKKPLMLIIHKTWCGACQSLKGKFAKAKMIAELAKNFIMVNAEDDEEPWEEEYYPDGGKYIPRIFFLSPEGEVLKDVINPKDEYKQYPYYYSNPAPIIHAMQNVLQRYGLAGGKSKASKEAVKEEAVESKKETEEKPDTEEKKEKKELPRKDKGKSAKKEEEEPQPPAQKPPEKEL